jgi:S-disulfanyl-L-cysteine oxidoreductase SoxD
MSRRHPTKFAVAACILPASALAIDGPDLGVAVTPQEVASWDISVGPDGADLPSGSGSVAQGAIVYKEKCAGCHGARGEGQIGDRLVGGFGTLSGQTKPVKTVGSFWPYPTTLFDYIRRAMPLLQPQSLSNRDVYAVTAYILRLNGIIGEREMMKATSLPKVKMPNRNKFFVVYPKNID